MVHHRRTVRENALVRGADETVDVLARLDRTDLIPVRLDNGAATGHAHRLNQQGRGLFQFITRLGQARHAAEGDEDRRLAGIEEGTQLPRPIVEFYYKDDALGEPLVSEEHIIAFNWATQQDMDDMVALALRVNDFLSGVMLGASIRLVDFKIEIGRVYEGDFQRLIVADEISPDSCRLWDIKTGARLDKDVFRQDLGDLADAYTEVASRLGLIPKNGSGSSRPKLVN